MTATVDVSGVQRTVHDFAVQKLTDVADRFVATAQGFAPRRTGALAESIVAGDVVESSSQVSCRIDVGAEYAVWQEQGTGIFGPDGAPITPKNGPVLVFDWPAAGGVVFARSVRGTEPTHFWQRTVELWSQIVQSV